MKRTMLCLALAAGLGMSLVAGTPSQASPRENWYGLLSITNHTAATLHYSLMWGDDGEWEEITLEPGETWTHWWEYDYANQNRSPVPTIRFDADMTAGVFWIEYDLERYAAPDTGYENSKQYVFEYTGWDVIDLHRDN